MLLFLVCMSVCIYARDRKKTEIKHTGTHEANNISLELVVRRTSLLELFKTMQKREIIEQAVLYLWLG